MFYKIDPERRVMAFDLGTDGFRAGDRLWVALRGDFQATPVQPDSFENTTFRFGTQSVDATIPTRFVTRSTDMVVLNHDRPLIDNSDPDGDYGVLVRIAPFSAGDDYFSFRSRTELPSVAGGVAAAYRAGSGDDLVIMPDAPLARFDAGRTFYAGSGDDEVRAGGLGLTVNFGSGDDTLVLRGATLDWDRKENRDNDGILDLRAGGDRYRISNAEVLKNGSREEPLHEWYFRIARERDGDLDIVFYEDGERILKAGGKYDGDVGIASGQYQAFFTKPNGRGSEQIELGDISGYRNVSIRDGLGRDPRTDFVTTEKFIDTVIDHIRDAYDDAGRTLPWRDDAFTPFSPVTVQISGATAAPGAASMAADAADRVPPVVADDLIG